MARPLRVEYPGAFYHVINRGNAGEKIFKSQSDKKKFLEYLQKAVDRFSIIIHTYCLMSNHYHVLIETPQANLGVAIQWLNVSYATYFNRKRQRSGHLFQGRFKALLIEADEYLKELSRYIHLNPVRANIVAKPQDYAWSSYPAFLKKNEGPEWLETGRILGYFGKRKKEAIKKYINFVEAIEIERLENPHKQAVGGFILGEADFITWVKETFLLSRKDEKEIPQLRELKPKVPIQSILEAVGAEFGSAEEQIVEKGRKRNKAREVAIYLARDLSGAKCKELGALFGGISGAAITMRYNQVAREVCRNKKLKGNITRIKKQILNI